MTRERTTGSSAYDTGADRCHLLVGERKRCRQDGVSVKVFNITFNGGPALCRRLLYIAVCIWRGAAEGGGAGVFHKKKDRNECNNHKCISLVAQSGKMLLQASARRFSEYCESVNHSTSDVMFVIHRLQGLAKKTRIPLYV